MELLQTLWWPPSYSSVRGHSLTGKIQSPDQTACPPTLEQLDTRQAYSGCMSILWDPCSESTLTDHVSSQEWQAKMPGLQFINP